MTLTEQHPVGRGGETNHLRADRILGSAFVLSLGQTRTADRRGGEGEITPLPESQVFTSPSRAYLVTKRIADVCLAGLALLLLSPLCLLIALAIFCEDRGPILFRQTRVGKHGKPFAFLKFRSMVPDAEALKHRLATNNEALGPIFKMRQDPRVTWVGRILRKYSLDELPQLLSVLGGQMSLVGPRPHLPCEVAQYSPRQRQRLSVQPGLICLREVCGRSHLSFERWIEMDLMYIEYRSLLTDLRILIRAIPAVVKGDGAY